MRVLDGAEKNRVAVFRSDHAAGVISRHTVRLNLDSVRTESCIPPH